LCSILDCGKPTDVAIADSHRRETPELLQAVLPAVAELHGDARRLIYGLIAGEEVAYDMRLGCVGTLRLDEAGRVAHQLNTGNWRELGYFYLVTTLLKPPFPYAACAHCNSIFVNLSKTGDQDRRQRYCSPGCAWGHGEVARREAKRRYMRELRASKAKKIPASGGRRNKSRMPKTKKGGK
jgi:hypothetical protein